MQAFLIAGHETTSGMLSFALIFLLQNPETYHKAQADVDRIVGGDSVTVQHIRDLKYVYAVLQETLRLVPTAPLIGKIPHPKSGGAVTTIEGKYYVEPTTRVRLLLSKCMQDPKVLGEDAREFRPERMLESNPNYTHIGSYWRPFSEGSRSFMGRSFSIQEAVLAMAVILQNFDLRLTDPMYKMRIRHAITVKPLGLYIKASLRHGMTPLDLEQRYWRSRCHKGRYKSFKSRRSQYKPRQNPIEGLIWDDHRHRQALAQRVASEVAMCGFNAEVRDMNASTNHLSKHVRTVIVTSVKDVEVLTSPGQQPEKRHMEIELPPESSYECGDYLAVLAQSPEANVRAVMSHFNLPNDATVTLKSGSFSPLPLNTSLSVADLLRNYYEIAQPATRRGLTQAIKHTKDEKTQKKFSNWLGDDKLFQTNITGPLLSLLDLLKEHPQVEMPLPTFLSLLPPLSIRQYSISSSPLRNPNTCTITYSVLIDIENGIAKSPFRGVAKTYLSTLETGDKIQVATRRTAKTAFCLPLDARKMPLLMFAAGTGIAPFRGFIEQRAIQLDANPNNTQAPAYLFLGCRSPERDRLYADKMDKWESVGAVKIYYMFSQEPERSDGCRHVPERMLKEVDVISFAWSAGARAYTCGNRAFAESVGKAALQILDERLQARKSVEWTDEKIEERKAEVLSSFNERAVGDVFD